MKSASRFSSRNRAGRTPHRTMGRFFSRVLRSQRGAASIEFVIVAPMMIMMMLGFAEVYMYIRAVSVVEHTAFTLADSIGQMQTVINNASTSNSNNLGSIFNAASLLAQPYDLKGKGMVVVSSICDNSSGCTPVSAPTMVAGAPKLLWQAKAPWSGSTMASQNSAVTQTNALPSGWPFRNGDSAIVVEVFLSYNPFTMTANFWSDAPGTQIISRRVYVRPRLPQPLTLAAS